MSSGYGQKSMEELKELALRNSAKAMEVPLYAQVKSEHWTALISANETALQILSEMEVHLKKMATRTQMQEDMKTHLEKLGMQMQAVQTVTEDLQEDLLSTAEQMQRELKTVGSETVKLAGSMSESFGKTLSEAEEKITKTAGKMLRLSLISMGVSVLSAVLLHIFLLI